MADRSSSTVIPTVQSAGLTVFHPSLAGNPHTAAVVLAAGRVLKTTACFEKMLTLADALQGQVVGTRGAVDMGWIPASREVGLSGLRLAPRIYFALGVSGANFHTIGMYRSKLIVAVNIEENARIFYMADYCICAEAETVLDGLLAALPGRTFQGTDKIETFLLTQLQAYPFRYNPVRKNE